MTAGGMCLSIKYTLGQNANGVFKRLATLPGVIFGTVMPAISFSKINKMLQCLH
jgi:hypothetical protein